MRSGFHPSELSLRGRLLAALIALTAVGLVALALVSYRELDSYLTDRVDQQVQAAVPQMTMELLEEAEIDAGAKRQVEGVDATEPGKGPAPGPDAAEQLPPGTYGQLLGPNGEVEEEVVIAFGESGQPKPAVPDDLAVGTRQGHAEPITVGESGGGSEQFRLVAAEAPGGRTTVVAVPLSDTQATLGRLALIELIVAGVVLLALAGAAWWLVGVGLRPLRRMEVVAGDIADGDLARRVEPANTKTEVGRLGLALNGMLTQIEGAFAEREASEARLRQFLADASHELRTPLAAIRGYAELYRMGASRAPDQVARAMGRIESESTRMSELVQDLFTLARIDEVREPERERVDLDVLMADACEDARATSPERRFELDVPDEVAVEGDAGQLRRVLVNLLANAVVHTPEDTPIEASVWREEEEAVAVVRDHGPGLPAGDPQAVFERFWRGSASRGRADGGAGLGLAIAAAIVTAHEGTIEAANAADGGAVFTVRLPLS